MTGRNSTYIAYTSISSIINSGNVHRKSKPIPEKKKKQTSLKDKSCTESMDQLKKTINGRADVSNVFKLKKLKYSEHVQLMDLYWEIRY